MELSQCALHVIYVSYGHEHASEQLALTYKSDSWRYHTLNVIADSFQIPMNVRATYPDKHYIIVLT